MKPVKRIYFVYIITNWNKTVLYTEVTNDLKRLESQRDDMFVEKIKCLKPRASQLELLKQF